MSAIGVFLMLDLLALGIVVFFKMQDKKHSTQN